ncbi:hypothetical protein DLJ49_08765 [Rhodovulum sp. 12E13]|uniref:hypothetical protein n=1 Tax=Rhodovulum sp. 12E13 TaxID=2203891 RepID=UPI000E1B3043|nr:hypothetical protein [Rhodovulum sp. 12E13]RDC73187.1 hypothetical protein DLJ49_08765 [Rhodovulum sp. 12E13]
MSLSERAETALAGAGDHEALLRRHGLISHVAILPEDTSPELAARFQSEASRVARNLIALAPRRFGVLLDAPDRPLSDIAYTLLPDRDGPLPDMATPGATDDGPARPGAVMEDAAPDQADAGVLPDAAAPGDEAAIRPHQPADADMADPVAPEAETAETEAPDAAPPETPATVVAAQDIAHEGPVPPTEPTRANAPSAAPRPVETEEIYPDTDRPDLPGGPASDLAERLDRIEARLDAMDVDGLVAAALPPVDDLLAARLEALEQRLLARAAAPADPFPAERVQTFWGGLEQALRLLHAQLSDLGGLAERLEAAADASGPGKLGDLELAVALGFEAAGEAREANQAALVAHLGSLDSGAAARAERLQAGLAGLADRIGVLEGALAALPSKNDRDAALVAAIGSMGDGIAALIDERLPLAEPGNVPADDGRLDRLSTQAEETLAALGWLDTRLVNLEAAIPSHQAEATGDTGALEQRIDALAARLEERGGILSDALETSHRSMKNFWLAAENALGRLDAALDRQVDAAPPGSVIGDRLEAIDARLARSEREGAGLRLALAELLARAERAAEPPDAADRDQ